MAHEEGTTAVLASLAANIGVAVTKFLAFLLTGASSMLAESIHSVADSGNQVLLLLGGRRSQREATPEHPFGYGRERYVYGFIVAIVLFSVGGLLSLVEAWQKLGEVRAGHPDELLQSRWWWVPIVVLLVSMALEGSSLWAAMRGGRGERGRRSWAQYIRRAKAPELPVVILENVAAMLGLTFALVGVGLTLVTDDAVWDVIGTALIGALLVVVAIVLAIEMKSLLVGEAATRQHQRVLSSAIAGAPGVDSIIHLRTMHLGPEELLVAAKLAVTPTDTASEVAAAIDAAEERAREALPGMSLMMYLEPDIRLPDNADAVRSSLETPP